MTTERIKVRALPGSLQYTPPILRLQKCPDCQCMAVLCPDIRTCAPCGVAAGRPTRYRFVQTRVAT